MVAKQKAAVFPSTLCCYSSGMAAFGWVEADVFPDYPAFYGEHVSRLSLNQLPLGCSVLSTADEQRPVQGRKSLGTLWVLVQGQCTGNWIIHKEPVPIEGLGNFFSGWWVDSKQGNFGKVRVDSHPIRCVKGNSSKYNGCFFQKDPPKKHIHTDTQTQCT